MPGRKSTGRLLIAPSSSNARNSKRKKERSLNALAIAEKADPKHTKIRRYRLGESEPGGNEKRKREVAQQDSSDYEIEGDHTNHQSNQKRRKTSDRESHGYDLDHGSDSEGNTWTLGGVASDDDESLDSDEAMGASDEEKFEGFTFRGSSSTRKTRKNKSASHYEDHFEGIDLSEGEEGEEEAEGFGDEGVDLATALDNGTENEDQEEPGTDVGSAESTVGVTGEVSGDEESTLSASSDEDNPQDQAKLASLQSLVMAMNEHDEAQVPKRRVSDVNEFSAPSEYGLSSKQKLTVADLLPSVKDPQLKKSLRLIADDSSKASNKRSSIAKKLDVPLAKRQQDRLDRTAAYEKSKETLNRWIDTVKHNRRAEHVSFPLQDPDAVNAQDGDKIGRQAKPLTDLESTIQNILQESGLAPTTGKSEGEQVQAFEELEANKMPLEEVQARRAELQRARELLFREEIKAKRINKIKSKSFRRIHRMERERLVQKDREALAIAGVEDSESEKERIDRRRAEERMGAKHREGRWAKGVKASGRMTWDEDARAGVEEMARREENLKRRILGKDVEGSDEEVSGDEEEDEEQDSEESSLRTLQGRLQRLAEDGEHLRAGVKDSTSALSSMKFMQNAEAARKASNTEAVQQMQRELAGEGAPSEEEPEDGLGRRLYGPNQNTTQSTKPRVIEQRNEFEERVSSDDEGDRPAHFEDDELQIIVEDPEPTKSVTPKEAIFGKARKVGARLSSSQPSGAIEENPWLGVGKRKSEARDRLTQDSGAVAIVSNELPDTMSTATFASKPTVTSQAKVAKGVEKGQVQSAPAGPMPDSDDEESGREAEEAEESSKAPFVLRHQELVRKAFAGDDVVAQFEEEKEERMQSEDEKMVDHTLAGWGSWIGAGIGKKGRGRKQKRFLSKQEGVPKGKRQDGQLDKVIINEKRVKKNARYLASQLPHPFETRQQYERSLRLPVGPEWTTKETFQAATKPRVLMKQGIITPMAKPII
ncbi:MAG: hypothetical protein LQ343_005003 [Gyalolechia ehrenbergii]|nr:MAG: hypothetical protein LQ343_005003 [Gyalolechia ehrenbergii]